MRPGFVMAQCNTRGTPTKRPATRSSQRFQVLPSSPTMRTWQQQPPAVRQAGKGGRTQRWKSQHKKHGGSRGGECEA